MSNLISSPGEGSPQPSAAQPSPMAPGSRPLLPPEPSSPPGSVLPLADLDVVPTPAPDRATLVQPRPLDGRDHEMIDFLVQKAIETCMPRRPEPPPPPGVRQRSINRKP